MSVTTLPTPAVAQRLAATLLPIMGVVFVAFLVIGIAMPALPLHVHDGLGQGTFVVGLVAGSQFAASLVSRTWAGNFSDSKGAKRGVAVGLIAAAAVPAHSRGLAMGAYTAFLDLAQRLASPALGLIAAGARLNLVFLVSAGTVLCATLVALWLMAHPTNPEGST